MSEERRRELGETEAPVEEELASSFSRIVHEGAERLARTLRAMFITGFFGGMEIGIGVMAYLGVLHATNNKLVAGLAFSIGLIALILAKSELFTENFLVPIIAVVSREASVIHLFKLWGSSLLANLLGGWIFMWIVITAFPQWKGTVSMAAEHYVEMPFNLQSICLAVLGGSTITLMTRMQHGTLSDMAKIVAAVAAGFLLSGLELFHSILDSLLIFGAIHAGADITYLQWLGWFGYTLLFNLAGGVLLVTALRLLRTKELVRERREQSPRNPDEPRRGNGSTAT